MRVGTPQHRDLFCRTFFAGHRDYDPHTFPWPLLDSAVLERLRAIPFWGAARAMENKAGKMVTGFAATLDDPVISAAVALQGDEETRHAKTMTELIDRYGPHADDSQVSPPSADKQRIMTSGYEECVDFFRGAGLFRLAHQLEMFTAPLLNVFEDVFIEEARHITFFVNWFRYEEARAGRDRPVRRHIVAIGNYLHSMRELVRSLGSAQTTGFAAAGANDIVQGITPVMSLEAALAENRRMLGLVDSRLVKPSLLPALATVALTAMRALPPRAIRPDIGGAQLADRANNRSVAA